MSIYVEMIWCKSKDKRCCIRTSGQSNVLNTLNKEFSSFNYNHHTIHNGETLAGPYECLLCADGCTEYADCMYSNCKHMCICYNCSSKLSNSQRVKCMICCQYNDCLIQVLKP